MKVIYVLFAFQFALLISNPANSQNPCSPNDETLCLLQSRFQIEIDWSDEAGNQYTVANTNQSGNAKANSLFDNIGSFWMFSSENHEFLVKMLDGCPVNGNFWFFSATTTNVEYTIRVTDTETSQVREYFNPQGVAAAPVIDTAAFATCPSENKAKVSYLEQPDKQINNTIMKPLVSSRGKSACVADSTTMCLDNNRFQVTVNWQDFSENTGTGQKQNFSDMSGYFWFFSEQNPELLVNIYDGTSVNDHYWVFMASTTNVEYTVSVTDTQTGDVKQYVNPLGNFNVLLDNQAFGIGELSGPEMPCINCESYTKKEVPATGFWYNPEQSGSGLSMEIKKRTVFGAYYGYDDSGNAVWYTFLGELQPSSTVGSMWDLESDLLQFEGGNSPNNSYQAPNLLESEHTIQITFNHLNHASFSIDNGTRQNIVPVPYGVSHQAYFQEQTSFSLPNLEGIWVISLRSNIDLYPFNPLIYGLQLPYLVAIDGPVYQTFGNGTKKVSYSVSTPDATTESMNLGSISCETFIDGNQIGGPDCYFETSIGFTGSAETIRYSMPMAGIGINKLFGESGDGHIFKAFRFDFCEYQPDNPQYECDEF